MKDYMRDKFLFYINYIHDNYDIRYYYKINNFILTKRRFY